MSILDATRRYYSDLNSETQKIANSLCANGNATESLLRLINAIYTSAKVEQEFKDPHFECAYHSPVTGQVEFAISRILYYVSQIKKLDWVVYLRRQIDGNAPDIRVECNGKTLMIIEIKTKAGWIQSFFSKEMYQHQLERFKGNKTSRDPDEQIRGLKSQIDKYLATFAIPKDNLYYLLPTLTHVHRKKFTTKISDYHMYFEKTSGLPAKQLILMSENLRLNLDSEIHNEKIAATNDFEIMVKRTVAQSANANHLAVKNSAL